MQTLPFLIRLLAPLGYLRDRSGLLRTTKVARKQVLDQSWQNKLRTPKGNQI